MGGSNGAKLLAAGCCAKSHRERQGILSFKTGETGSIDWPEDASTLGLANWPFWTGFHRSQQVLRGSVQTDMAASSPRARQRPARADNSSWRAAMHQVDGPKG